MKTPRVVTRRRLAVALVFLLVVAWTTLPPLPAWATGGDPNCDPGNNCTGFEHGTYVVTEGDGYLDINVLAAWCCPVGQGQIDYATFDGSARAGQDFQRTSGTLTYAGGGWGGIRIPITDDTLSEGQEQFEVRLTNFRGSFVRRGHETARVRIFDRNEEQEPVSSESSAPASPPSTARTAPGPKVVPPQLHTAAAPGLPALAVGGSVSAQNQADETEAGAPSDLSGPGDPHPAAARSAMERPASRRPSTGPLAGLASLLLVATVVWCIKGHGAKPDLTQGELPPIPLR